jgi:hypothetical protein
VDDNDQHRNRGKKSRPVSRYTGTSAPGPPVRSERAPVSSDLVFAVFLKRRRYEALCSGEASSSSDRFRYRRRVRRFLQANGLPCPNPFLSFGAFVGEVPADCRLHQFGDITGFLNPKIIAETSLIASDDVQGAASGGFRDRFAAVSGTHAEREATIRQLLARTQTARAKRDYAEGRCSPQRIAQFTHFDVSRDAALAEAATAAGLNPTRIEANKNWYPFSFSWRTRWRRLLRELRSSGGNS